MLQNLLSTEDGGGGGAPAPSAVDSIVTDPAPVAPSDLPEWAKGIEAELMGDPVMKNVRDIPSLVKGYVHAQRMVGRDKAIIPNERSKPEEWKSYFNKIGLPEKIEDYKVDIKESLFTPEQLDKIKAAAYENNVLPNQFQKMMELFNQEQNAIIDNQNKTVTETLKEASDSLKKEWGEGYQKNINNAASVVKHFGGKEMMDYLDASGLGNDVKLIKFLAGVGSKLNKEDTFHSDTVERFSLTKDEASAKLNAMRADMNNPMFNRNDPRHNDALKEMLRYQEILDS